MEVDASRNRRYFSFSFMLDPQYEVPYAWVLHLQVWQCCGGHPPFTMQVIPANDKAGPVKLTFGVHDDAAERAPRHPEHVLYEVGVRRGEWHHVMLFFEPQSDASSAPGSIVLWMDGARRFDFKGRWGYDPQQRPFDGHSFGPNMAIEFGIYRQRQATTQTIYFSNVKYGRSLADIERD